jgi:hypothetical protein
MSATLLMPEGTGFYLDDIRIRVSWYPIEQTKNNTIYVELYHPLQQFNPNQTTVTEVIQIEEGSYIIADLGNVIANAINGAFTSSNFSVTSNYVKRVEQFTFSSTSGRYRRILTDTEIAKKVYIKPFGSLNSVLQNITLQLHTTIFRRGYINLYAIRNIYITSYGLGNFNTMNISGERPTVNKVPVIANYGGFNFDATVIGMDYLDCSNRFFLRSGFRMNNIYGEPINLHGHHLSFSIVLYRIQEIM